VFDTCNPDTLIRYPKRIICFADPPAVRMAPLMYEVSPFPEGLSGPANLKGLFAIRVRPMDRISVWVIGLSKPAISSPPPAPYRMELQLRVGFDCNSYAPPPRIIQPAGWMAPDQTEALLFQFTGITATQFELWGCTIAGGPAGPDPGTQFVTFAVLISSTYGACCDPPGFFPGDWDITA